MFQIGNLSKVNMRLPTYLQATGFTGTNKEAMTWQLYGYQHIQYQIKGAFVTKRITASQTLLRKCTVVKIGGSNTSALY